MSERTHLVESAGFWFKASRTSDTSQRATFCMENAYNHVENALATARRRIAELEKELDERGSKMDMKHTVYWLTCEDQNIGTWTSVFASREAFEAELVRIMRLAIEQHGEDARKRTKEVEALIAADRIMAAWDVFYEPGSIDPSPLCNPDDYYWQGNEELDFPEA